MVATPREFLFIHQSILLCWVHSILSDKKSPRRLEILNKIDQACQTSNTISFVKDIPMRNGYFGREIYHMSVAYFLLIFVIIVPMELHILTHKLH